MAGSSWYYHGESGYVVDRRWTITPDGLRFELELRDDPHRHIVYSWGTDIGIDHTMRPGDETVYLGLGSYDGVWIERSRATPEKLDEALARVGRTHNIIRRHNDVTPFSPKLLYVVPYLLLSTGIRVQIGIKEREWVDSEYTLAEKRVSVFLSYSGTNVMPARHFHRVLTANANADVWFDRANAGEAPIHDEEIGKWLQEGIFASRVFVVLWTSESSKSKWVPKELAWAQERAHEEADFILIILKLEKIPPPPQAEIAKYVIDCGGCTFWEAAEELYAAVYQRETRRQWLEKHRRFAEPLPGRSPLNKNPYFFYESDAGIAVDLKWHDEARKSWQLTYESRSNGRRTVSGPTRSAHGNADEDIVDPEIRRGDLIGSGRVHGLSRVWMKTDDLDRDVEKVVEEYHKVMGVGVP